MVYHIEWYNGDGVVQRGVAAGPSLYTALFNKSALKQHQYKCALNVYGKIKALLVSDGIEEFVRPLQITSLNFWNNSTTEEKFLVEHGGKSCSKSAP